MSRTIQISGRGSGVLQVLLVLQLWASLGEASEGVLALNSPSDAPLLFNPAPGSKPLFVKFYAPWCGHCKALAPTWATLATSLADSVTIAHVDCTIEDHGFCTAYGIRSFPTLKLITADKKVYSFSGSRTEKDITDWALGGYKTSTSETIPRKPAALDDFLDKNGKLKEIDNVVATSLEQAPGLLPSPPETSFPAPPKHSSLKGTPGDSPAMGSPSAPVKLIIWSDFQCPNCRRSAEPLKWLALKYPTQVQVIFKQLPLEMHKKAYPCATATLAAHKQGKFWEFHDLLWKTRKINEEDLVAHAKTLSLDIVKWTADRQSTAIKEEIEYDISLADALGITGTPGIFVNGRLSKGWGSVFGVDSMVKASLRTLEEKTGKLGAGADVAYELTKLVDENMANLIWGKETKAEKKVEL